MTDALSVFAVIVLVWAVASPFLGDAAVEDRSQPITVDEKERILVQLAGLENDLRIGKVEHEEYLALKEELLREAAKIIS